MVAFLKKTETIFKLCLICFFLLLMWTARTYPQKSRLFPTILGVITVVFLITSFVQDFLKTKKGTIKEEVKEPEAPPSDILEEKMRMIREVEEKAEDAGYEVLEESLRKKRLWQSVAIILISLGIGYVGGFLLTVPFYFICFGLFHGQKKQALKYIIIAIGVTLVTYLGFTTLMEVPLLKGLWWG